MLQYTWCIVARKGLWAVGETVLEYSFVYCDSRDLMAKFVSQYSLVYCGIRAWLLGILCRNTLCVL